MAQKPHDIGFPEMIDHSPFADIVALVFQDSPRAFNPNLVLYKDPGTAKQVDIEERDENWYWKYVYSQSMGSYKPAHLVRSSPPLVLQPGEVLECGIGLSANAKQPLAITAEDLTRFHRIAQAIRQGDDGRPIPTHWLADTVSFVREMRLCPRYEGLSEVEFFEPLFYKSGNVRFNNLDTMRVTGSRAKKDAWLICLGILMFAYGGIHLAAWSFHFPTLAEAIIWKVSCILPFCIYLFWNIWECIDYDSGSGVVEMVGRWSVASVILFCRMFLVIESFISLRSVPIGVYWTPAWLEMIPHI